MKISLIVAATEAGVIGRDNQLLWRLPSDLKRFRRLTMGKPIVMGRKTFQSIGKVLDGRDNIIVSRDPQLQVEGGFVVHSIDEGMAVGRQRAEVLGTEDVMVIGGAEIYKATLDVADKVYLTLVDADLEGDAFFPALDPAVWQEVSCEPHVGLERHEYDFSFKIYERLSGG